MTLLTGKGSSYWFLAEFLHWLGLFLGELLDRNGLLTELPPGFGLLVELHHRNGLLAKLLGGGFGFLVELLHGDGFLTERLNGLLAELLAAAAALVVGRCLQGCIGIQLDIGWGVAFGSELVGVDRGPESLVVGDVVDGPLSAVGSGQAVGSHHFAGSI